jgi:hypothetical protein
MATVINVVEMEGNRIISIESFPIWDEQESGIVEQEAEEAFISNIKEHSDTLLSDEEIESYYEEWYFSNDYGYACEIVRSSVY